MYDDVQFSAVQDNFSVQEKHDDDCSTSFDVTILIKAHWHIFWF